VKKGKSALNGLNFMLIPRAMERNEVGLHEIIKRGGATGFFPNLVPRDVLLFLERATELY